MERRTGGCLCGDIRFAADGEPRRTIACHCTFCQRFTGGGAFLVESLYYRECVTFSGPALGTYEHQSDESGRSLTLQFCRRCATTLGMQLEWNPRTQTILAGCLDDPNSVKAEIHLFTRSARRDVWLPHDAVCYSKHYLLADGSLDSFAVPIKADAPWRNP